MHGQRTVFNALAGTVLALACAVVGPPAQAQYTQQGSKLVPTNEIGMAFVGSSVSISADGNTAIVGGNRDNSSAGAAWIYTRSNGVWTQGPKLVGTGAVGSSQQGFSVAISGDGNTAIVGGVQDASYVGAAWIFARGSNGGWTQQGAKLVGADAIGAAEQGSSVAISADGNTAMVGGSYDDSQKGAAWVYTRNNGVWAQQGPKLVGAGAVGSAQQGASVALSADGNTAIVGGFNDNFGAGAAWIFTRDDTLWIQQGFKLVGTGAVGLAAQGSSVAVSGDGSTAIIGGYSDSSLAGAAWIFTRSNGGWTQQGPKLVGGGAAGAAGQGWSVALTYHGDTAVVGGVYDNNSIGAIWTFKLKFGSWTQNGSKLVGSGYSGQPYQGGSVALSAKGDTMVSGASGDNGFVGAAWVFTAPSFGIPVHDFDADGKSDVLWRNVSGDAAIWLMNGAKVSLASTLGNVATAWSVVGTGDFDGDGHSDILWRNTAGDLVIWFMNGAQVVSTSSLGNVPTAWTVAGTGDFDGNGRADILWRNTSGDATIWFMNGSQIVSGSNLGNIPSSWSVAGVGDFDGDGKSDILWRNTSGDAAIWFIDGGLVKSGSGLGNVPTAWSVAGVRDFNGDAKADILWRNTSGDIAMWLMNGAQIASGQSVGNVPTVWSIVQTADFSGDGKSDIFWRSNGGDLAMWLMNGAFISSGTWLGNVSPDWSVQNVNAN